MAVKQFSALLSTGFPTCVIFIQKGGVGISNLFDANSREKGKELDDMPFRYFLSDVKDNDCAIPLAAKTFAIGSKAFFSCIVNSFSMFTTQ